MKDLRESVRMALDGFEQIYKSCGFVEEKETKLHKHAKQLSTYVRADCKNYMEQLRQALENTQTKISEMEKNT
jgi:hypothetical protein